MTSSFSSTLPSETTRESLGWSAALDVVLGPNDGPTTRVLSRDHSGPLVVQRAFYPEADGTCHLYLIHPPGGLVSGDRLTVKVRVEASARALLTTPAATKFYRARDGAGTARQHVSCVLAEGAHCEWLPQESIVFSGAQAELVNRIEVGRGAVFLGSEVTCLGRPASGETFDRGRLVQRWEVRLNGALRFVEHFVCEGGSELLRAPYALASAPVYATLLAVADAVDEPLVEEVRTALDGADGFSVTARDGVLIARYLGSSSERAHKVLRRAWAVLRTNLLHKTAVAPRIWAT